MSGFVTDVPALYAAERLLGVVGDDLAADFATLSAQVEGLLRSGWSGSAAASFGQAWRDWEKGLQDAQSGLALMARTLRDCGHAYAQSDDEARAALHAAGSLG